MKQSNKQPLQVAVDLPSYVSIKNWQDIVSVEKSSNIYYKMHIISRTTGLSDKEVRKLPMQILPKLYSDCAELYLEKPSPVSAIRFNGKTLVFSASYDKSVGEFADLEAAVKNLDIPAICGIMFREVEGELEGEWEQLYEGVEVLPMMLKDSIDQLKPYDCQDSVSADFFKDFPLSIYNANLAFILGIGASFSISSVNYSKMTPAKEKKLVNELTCLGDGLITYSILERLTFLKSEERVA